MAAARWLPGPVVHAAALARWHRLAGAPPSARLAVLADEVLDRPHGEALGGGPLGQDLLVAAVGVPRRARAWPGDLTLGEEPLGPGRKLEQSQGVGHPGPARPTRVAT